jgi:hypothetical protein
MHIAATFFVRQALDRVGRRVREDLRFHMDRELMFRLAKQFKVKLIPRTFVAFRKHGESQSWSVDKMIAFGEEFARVQDLFLGPDDAENRKRRQIANQHKAKGYLKFAKYSSSVADSAKALFTVLRLQPAWVLQRQYLKAWLRTLGLCLPLR